MDTQPSANTVTPATRKVINMNPVFHGDICNTCGEMTQSIDGIYRLMTGGYLHHSLRFSDLDITIPTHIAHGSNYNYDNDDNGNVDEENVEENIRENPEENDKPISPPETPPNGHQPQFFLPPPGYECLICHAVLTVPKASKQGSEVLHHSVFHKYNKNVIGREFRHINFYAITSNARGEEVDNPLKDRKLSRRPWKGRSRIKFINSTEVVEYMKEENIHISGIVAMRGDEEMARLRYHVPVWPLFRKNLHFKGQLSNCRA
ncbi:hypothetical protein NHQ30_000846 [Ciborinia camelliae]|nr:hypothetical protein NHQ30_000846 [Ciborinia camelliae]